MNSGNEKSVEWLTGHILVPGMKDGGADYIRGMCQIVVVQGKYRYS